MPSQMEEERIWVQSRVTKADSLANSIPLLAKEIPYLRYPILVEAVSLFKQCLF